MARILIVDDENNIRMMMRLSLQHVGHLIDTAADGQEALDKFGDGSGYDLVVLDQRMPGLEGITVLNQMRYTDPQARIIMATAFGTIDLAVDAMKAGATDFLRKPFSSETLRDAVASALNAQRETVPAGVTFASTTINGYRIEFKVTEAKHTAAGFQQDFTISDAESRSARCTVVLPNYVAELVRAHADRDEIPGGDRFWQALCEEALANYLWQHAEFPPDGQLRLEDLTTGLRRFVDVVLTAGTPEL